MSCRAALILLGAVPSAASAADSYLNFIRQNQQDTGIVWDMPVAPAGTSPSALVLDRGGALFQLWTINQTSATSYLLDQKLVGVYLPTADLRIVTLDPCTKVHRTRVDQPFSVEILVGGLLSGPTIPLAATKVLLERHLANYPADSFALVASAVATNTPMSSAYLTNNGMTKLRFDVSALTAADPLKASGEEHFIVHALSDGTFKQTQIASGIVQVWPVATGAIKGIAQGDVLRLQMPQVELLLNELYPRSDTYLLLFEGDQISDGNSIIVTAFPMDRDTTASSVIPVAELDKKITHDGTYSLALVSDTPFGRDLLASVTFSVNRTLQINAMQVEYAEDSPN